MDDPVLDAHRLLPMLYTISGAISPLSIRDQILRAVVLVDRLIDHHLLTAGSGLLVVVGAGAGGASAAIRAAQRGVPTLLVEAGGAPFLTQSEARTRIVDPTQYDWPLDHAAAGRIPWGRHAPLPLQFRTNSASALSLLWAAQLQAAQTSGIPLNVRYNIKASVAAHSASSLGVSLSTPAGGTPVIQNANVLIWAAGVGTENCKISSSGSLLYEGQPFWGPDRFMSISPANRVLISGTGDGAIQDYLRIVIGKRRAIEILHACSIPASIQSTIQSAEDRAHRGRSWASPGTDTSYLVELDYIHRQAADAALKLAIVQAGLRTLVPSLLPDIHVVDRSAHICAYYGLNRFLAHLVTTYIKQEHGHETIFPGNEILAIYPASPRSHQCIAANRASGTYSPHNVLISHTCFQQPHDVIFTPSATSTHRACLPNSIYDVIIVRHGILLPPVPLPGPTLNRTRHLLPYHRP